ncbi:hypothetical protein QVD17_41890 [Tagetes erecta]|uniref:Uncharacterized protein n=1 Tax=Tagetes erecta TaxID=13708 RepID=A0AAD8JRG4_TARER|nr:hypothetical protein QVD17_41890 [Tagetes erecta]
MSALFQILLKAPEHAVKTPQHFTVLSAERMNCKYLIMRNFFLVYFMIEKCYEVINELVKEKEDKERLKGGVIAELVTENEAMQDDKR